MSAQARVEGEQEAPLAKGPLVGAPQDRKRTGAALDLSLARRLWPFVKPHRRMIGVSLALLLTGSAAGLATTWLLKIAIDQHVARGDFEGLWLIVVGFAALATVELVAKGRQTWTVDVAGQNALLDLRMAVFTHLQRLSSSFYDKTPIGRLVGRVTTDVEALQELFSSGVVTILGDLVVLGVTAGILFWMDWQLALATMLIVPVLLALTLWIRVRVRGAYDRMIIKRSHLNAFLHEHVVGMPLIQAFLRERRAATEFGTISGDLRNEQVYTVWWESSLSALTEMLESLTIALILWFGGALLLGTFGSPDSGPGAGLTLGALFAFIHYMGRFFAPLIDLSLKYTVLQNAMTAADRIFHLLDQKVVVPEPANPKRPPTARGEIVFDDVTFGYDPAEPVLQGLSFRVAPGERIAIVGATGAGKTTILRLLTRLYDVTGGRILLDGVDVREYALADLRRRVGIVPQDVFLFGGDVLENVRLGHPEISDEQARAAATRLHLDQVVARFPRGYREPVRERGANLSAGERQLVAFARVMAVAPPVLALDEATSNVDTNTEHLLQEAVHEITLGRTSLVIAHRLSTVRDVDRILVLNRGRLVEEGSHDALVAASGPYAKLYELQFAGADGAPR